MTQSSLISGTVRNHSYQGPLIELVIIALALGKRISSLGLRGCSIARYDCPVPRYIFETNQKPQLSAIDTRNTSRFQGSTLRYQQQPISAQRHVATETANTPTSPNFLLRRHLAFTPSTTPEVLGDNSPRMRALFASHLIPSST